MRCLQGGLCSGRERLASGSVSQGCVSFTSVCPGASLNPAASWFLGGNDSFPLSLQLTVYLGKRDFVDHLDHVDPVGEDLAGLFMF